MAEDASEDQSPEVLNPDKGAAGPIPLIKRGAQKTKQVVRQAEIAVWKNVAQLMYGEANATPEQRRTYIDHLRHEVEGWNGPGAFAMIDLVADYQQTHGVFGSACEIGVHHGQLFVYLMMLLRERENGLAIDLFDDQHLNLDKSGRGDRQIFTENIRQYCTSAEQRIKVHVGDSNQLKGGQISDLAEQPVRMFSVDGGHWRDVVVNDLYVAADGLHEAGVVILDDVFNAFFPGVGEGLAAYVHEPTPKQYSGYRNVNNRLKPFAIGCNKVLLCLERKWEDYSQLFAGQYIGEAKRAEVKGWKAEKIIALEF